MENSTPEHLAENTENKELWLTDRLLEQLRFNARIGAPLMWLGIITGISVAGLSLFSLFWYWSQIQGDFYLFEGGNLYRTVNLLAKALMIYCFAKAILHGHKAWQSLRFSETDDDALLEGSDRLWKMFRWLTLWGGVYIGFIVLQYVWSVYMGFHDRPSGY